MSCGVGPRHSLDLVVLRPWCRLAAAVPIQPLTWELPYGPGMALKKKKNKIKQKELGVVTAAAKVPFLAGELPHAVGMAPQKVNKDRI